MPADFVIKEGDSLPLLTDELTLSDGSPVNLSGATVQFVMRSLMAPAQVSLTGTASITDFANGKVQFTFSGADTGQAGMYMGNWLVSFSGGQQMTFPTVGYLWVSVEENLTDRGGQQLVGLPDVKDYLNIDHQNRAHDAKLLRFITAVRPLIEQITGPIIPTIFEEWHDGGQPFVTIRRRPSTAPGTDPVLVLLGCDEYLGAQRYPLQLVGDPSRGTTYSAMLTSDGVVTRRSAGGGTMAFAGGLDSVHVTYQAGQRTVPANVYEGALEAIRVNYQTTQQTGRGRLTQSDELDSGPPLGFFLPRRVRELLSPNRRHPSIA